MELSQLLKECRKNSITAQKYLYDRFSLQMFLVCRRYLKTDEQAEETLLAGFLKIFTGIQRFEYVNEAATVGWMKKIMANECLQALRQKNSFLVVAEINENEADTGEDVISKMSADELFKLIMALPLGYRTVFNLFVMEEMTHKEIAAALNIAEGTSKSQLNKAKIMLQQFIGEQNKQEYAGRKTK